MVFDGRSVANAAYPAQLNPQPNRAQLASRRR